MRSVTTALPGRHTDRPQASETLTRDPPTSATAYTPPHGSYGYQEQNARTNPHANITLRTITEHYWPYVTTGGKRHGLSFNSTRDTQSTVLPGHVTTVKFDLSL